MQIINRELIEREIKMLSSVQEGFDSSATNQQTKVVADVKISCRLRNFLEFFEWSYEN